MLPLVLFTKVEELQSLTGLSSQELRESGFDLDDWNWGIQVTDSMGEMVYYDCDDNECPCDSLDFSYSEFVWEEEYGMFFRKLSAGEDIQCIEYDEKYYYICYH